MKTISATALLLLGLLCQDIFAEEAPEVGVLLGAHLFSPHSDFKTKMNGSIPSDGLIFGIRGSLTLSPHWKLEPEAVLMPTQSRASHKDMTIFSGRLFGRFDLLPVHQLRPFILTGAGLRIATSTHPNKQSHGATGIIAFLGTGLEIDLTPGLALRADTRLGLSPSTDSSSPSLDFEFVIAFSQRFPKMPAPVPADSDGDGVFDDFDQCPEKLEDQDGFNDEDGCPELDNDNDGFLDKVDPCPSDAEDFSETGNNEGCPDTFTPPTE